MSGTTIIPPQRCYRNVMPFTGIRSSPQVEPKAGKLSELVSVSHEDAKTR